MTALVWPDGVVPEGTVVAAVSGGADSVALSGARTAKPSALTTKPMLRRRARTKV